jgi:heptosyltransferase-3
LRGARTAGVDDIKRRKPFWIKSFSSISPEAGDGHIVKRNLAALEALGLTSIEEKRELSLIIPQEIKNSIEKIKKNHRLGSNYCVFHTVSRRETKLWIKESFAQLIDRYADQGLKVVLTSGPDEKEINYLKDIEKLTKTNFINLGGETRLIELAALIKDAKFFLGLDSVASHIAAAVETKGVALFGPSNPKNWRPWSNKVSVISRGKEEEFCQAHGHMEGKYKKCLCYINPERVIEELDKLVN